MASSTVVTVEFSGGLEALTVDSVQKIVLTLHDGPVNIGQLIAYIRDTVVGARREVFANEPVKAKTGSQQIKVDCDLHAFSGTLNTQQTAQIRPGVLVLVDNVDWELLGAQDYILKDKQLVSFISTLHGG